MFGQVARVKVTLYGSLALTGVGHATDFAVIAGLLGKMPEDIDPELSRDGVSAVRRDKKTCARRDVTSLPSRRRSDLVLHKAEFLPEHPNGMIARGLRRRAVRSLHENAYFSIGGGAVLDREALAASRRDEMRCGRAPCRPIRRSAARRSC